MLTATRFSSFLPLNAFVGFDELIKTVDSGSWRADNSLDYPPHNIVSKPVNGTGSEWIIELAVAGFSKADLNVELHKNTLTIEGTKEFADEREYAHKGISSRDFRKRFTLAEHVKIASTKLENGILSINLILDVPEAEKARQIKIGD